MTRPGDDQSRARTSSSIISNCRYGVVIDGMDHAVFSEISGLQIETETMDLIEGGYNDRVKKIPVRSRVGNLILKRGVTVGNSLVNWHLRIVQGYLDLRNVTVIVYQTNNNDVIGRYELLNAFPVKWSGPVMAGGGETVAVETLELAHEGFLNVTT